MVGGVRGSELSGRRAGLFIGACEPILGNPFRNQRCQHVDRWRRGRTKWGGERGGEDYIIPPPPLGSSICLFTADVKGEDGRCLGGRGGEGRELQGRALQPVDLKLRTPPSWLLICNILPLYCHSQLLVKVLVYVDEVKYTVRYSISLQSRYCRLS